ncbi:MAG: tetratricopeptide repeat protein, partial [Chitinophagaceae bacterium]|nr:tetratricopeptide repeat protein [Chitinophagaceae bacterium]
MNLCHRILKAVCCFLIVLFFVPAAFAQLGKITVDLKTDKPKKFQTRTLKSEKTGDKKFTVPRKFIQNTASHYNYYFNANNKINDVIERARIANTDNYYKLLPFYSYSLNNTAAQSAELDSVIYKATAGILLHDLRSSWVDNFYLLIGKAYLLGKKFDSASMTFQFINYNLYPKKKKDEDQMIVGSNLNTGGGNTVSIANKEKNSIITKTFSKPPSRNDALVWQIRTLIEMDEYPDAAGLINTLLNDANFPARLKPDLEEVNAYWFYKQGIYDSAATHLEKGLLNASDVQEKARSEYLLAQLFELTKNRTKASEYYNKAIRHTTDPLLDIYANLSNAKMYDSSGLNEIDISISHLLRMSKKDKFEIYRDIIYFSAGELALEKPDTAAAEFFFKKSIEFNLDNIPFKNKAFLKLADINFIRKNYKAAFANYDSLQTSDTTLLDLSLIQERRNTLSKIVEKINIIEREDSLQRIALMPAADREAFIKKMVKQLRKERGLKDNDNFNTSPSSVFDNRDEPLDIFAANNIKGDWYFYNASVKSKGYNEFKSKWGKRPNVDNWRRAAASEVGGVNAVANNKATDLNNNNVNNNIVTSGDVDDVTPINEAAPSLVPTNNVGIISNISYDGLLENLPTTDEKLKASHTLLSNALFQLGKLYQNTLEDYGIAAETYETSLQRYPDSLYGGELYMNLSYCYQKLGDISKSNHYKNLLNGKFRESKFAQIINNPKAETVSKKNTEATKRYEAIYNLFIEGQFDKALQEKKAADSLYANNYWTPQLLYIESVYYIKQKQDSLALEVLNTIVNLYPNSALKTKALTMIDVLGRRSEIEGYLTDLQIERAKEDAPVVISETPVNIPVERVQNIDSTNKNIEIKKPDDAKQDSAIINPAKENEPALANKTFNFIPATPQFVIMLLDKVDPVYISEARNAFNRYNREKFSGQNIEILKEVIDKDKSLLVFRQFADAP